MRVREGLRSGMKTRQDLREGLHLSVTDFLRWEGLQHTIYPIHFYTMPDLIIKLNKSNYDMWSLVMKVLLIRKDLWDVVDGSEPRPAGSANSKVVRAYVKKLQQVHAEIILNIEPDQHLHVREGDASEIWESLRKVHTARGFASRLSIRRRLLSMTKGESVMSWGRTEDIPRFYIFGEDSASAYVLRHQTSTVLEFQARDR